jgi:hypothetical protein
MCAKAGEATARPAHPTTVAASHWVRFMFRFVVKGQA